MSRSLKRIVAHILVCDHKHCHKRGSRECAKEMRARLKEQGLRRSVLVTSVGCLDACDDGPVVCVYPDGVWYREVDAEIAKRIIDDHIVRGQIVKRGVLCDLSENRAAASDINGDDVDEGS